jgi:hypothetical protein
MGAHPAAFNRTKMWVHGEGTWNFSYSIIIYYRIVIRILRFRPWHQDLVSWFFVRICALPHSPVQLVQPASWALLTPRTPDLVTGLRPYRRRSTGFLRR